MCYAFGVHYRSFDVVSAKACVCVCVFPLRGSHSGQHSGVLQQNPHILGAHLTLDPTQSLGRAAGHGGRSQQERGGGKRNRGRRQDSRNG